MRPRVPSPFRPLLVQKITTKRRNDHFTAIPAIHTPSICAATPSPTFLTIHFDCACHSFQVAPTPNLELTRRNTTLRTYYDAIIGKHVCQVLRRPCPSVCCRAGRDCSTASSMCDCSSQVSAIPGRLEESGISVLGEETRVEWARICYGTRGSKRIRTNTVYSTESDPSDFKTICSSEKALSYLSDNCGDNLKTAQDYFADICKTNGEEVKFPDDKDDGDKDSTSTESSSPTATRSGSGSSASETGGSGSSTTYGTFSRHLLHDLPG